MSSLDYYYKENLAGELERVDPKDITDGYHTFAELYEYRMLYNAALFNEWARNDAWIEGMPPSFSTDHVFDVHKSWKHSDGELCFGGGWFIVMANLPTGQISNHYEEQHWHLFQVPTKEQANEYDGHTPEVAAIRLKAFLNNNLGPN